MDRQRKASLAAYKNGGLVGVRSSAANSQSQFTHGVGKIDN